MLGHGLHGHLANQGTARCTGADDYSQVKTGKWAALLVDLRSKKLS